MEKKKLTILFNANYYKTEQVNRVLRLIRLVAKMLFGESHTRFNRQRAISGNVVSSSDLFQYFCQLFGRFEPSARSCRSPAFRDEPRQQRKLRSDLIRNGVEESVRDVDGEGVGRKDALANPEVVVVASRDKIKVKC